ncbi:MAG: hypothetical protein NHB32_16015 [Fischerella sp. CENA71]|nr:hypothetical protein [Fischerella sp. CENA71]
MADRNNSHRQQSSIALLKDREVGTLAKWLENYPGIQVLSRDRSKAYKNAMTQGAPQAIQVAEFLKNLLLSFCKTSEFNFLLNPAQHEKQAHASP